MSKQTDGENPVNPRLREALLIERNGTPLKQKDALVQEILSSFQDPSNWPMTDNERVMLLRSFYRKAKVIVETEAPIKAASV